MCSVLIMKESYQFWIFQCFVPSLSLHKQMCGARCYLIPCWWWLATINFVNVSPLLPSPCIQISNPDDPLIYARLHQHRQLVDQIFIDFSTDFTSSTSSLARHVAGWAFSFVDCVTTNLFRYFRWMSNTFSAPNPSKQAFCADLWTTFYTVLQFKVAY